MGFRFQRRISIGGGLGLNLSKSGVSPSLRTSRGSISPRGFSIRTGIPGLNYRSAWGTKNLKDTAIALILLWLTYKAIMIVFAAIIISVLAIFQSLRWLFLTGYDFIRYLHGYENKPPELEAEEENKVLPEQSGIDFEAYSSFNECADSAMNLLAQLREDEKFLINFKINDSTTDNLHVVFVYEIMQILKIAKNHKTVEVKSNHGVGLLLIFLRLYGADTNKILNYEKLDIVLNDEKSLENLQQSLDSVYTIKIVSDSSTVASENIQKEQTDVEMKARMPLSTRLKALNHPSHQPYCELLLKIGRLLLQQDGVIPYENEPALLHIESLIKEPIGEKYKSDKIGHQQEIATLKNTY